MKRSLVLSGGASKIAFQLGAFEALQDKQFTSIYGISCGAILAAMLGQNKLDIAHKVILNLENRNVYQGKISVFAALKAIILGKESVLDTTPLRKMLTENVRKEDFVVDTYFSFVDMFTGEFMTFSVSECVNTEAIIDCIMASAAMPLAMPPVKNRYFDGGIYKVSPLSEAIKGNPDEIVIVNCFNRAEKVKNDCVKIPQIAFWLLSEAMPANAAKSSIEPFLMLNEVLRQMPGKEVNILFDGKLRTIRYFDYLLIEPTISLGDSFDFSANSMLERWKHGLEVVMKNKTRNFLG